MDNKSSMSANGFVEDADINILEKYYNTMNLYFVISVSLTP